LTWTTTAEAGVPVRATKDKLKRGATTK